MSVGSWILIIVIIVAVIGTIVGNKQKRWYKLYLANNDVILAYRKMSPLWSGDSPTHMKFKLADGKNIMISRHWILKIEEDNEPTKKN